MIKDICDTLGWGGSLLRAVGERRGNIVGFWTRGPRCRIGGTRSFTGHSSVVPAMALSIWFWGPIILLVISMWSHSNSTTRGTLSEG